MRTKLLIDGATATNATKVRFDLQKTDFEHGDLPTIKSRGLGSGDSVKIYELVNDDWQDSGQSLSDSQTSLAMRAVGSYSVDITMATAGPASVAVQSSADY